MPTTPRHYDELADSIRDTLKVEITHSNVDQIIEWVSQHYGPEDVFSTTQLDKWAESEGYTKDNNQ